MTIRGQLIIMSLEPTTRTRTSCRFRHFCIVHHMPSARRYCKQSYLQSPGPPHLDVSRPHLHLRPYYYYTVQYTQLHGKHLSVLERYGGKHSRGEGPRHVLVWFVGNASVFGSLAQNAKENVKEKEVRWDVVTSVCVSLIVPSVPCEHPKLEAAEDHYL